MSRERASRRFYRVDSTNYLFEFMDRGYTAQHENRWNFEVAWEAANKGMTCVCVYIYVCVCVCAHIHTHININFIRKYIIWIFFLLILIVFLIESSK